MKASKAILLGLILSAASLAMAEPASKKVANKEHLALINKYFAAVNKQNLKRAMEVVVARAVDPAIKACAYAKAFGNNVGLPVKVSTRKTDAAMTVYDVSITEKTADKTTQRTIVMGLKVVGGQLKIVAIATPKQSAAGLAPAVFKEDRPPDPEFVDWAYKLYLDETRYIKEMTARAAPDRWERGDNCLRQPYYSDVKSFEPAAYDNSEAVHIRAHVYEGLYAYHYLKRPAKIIPLLADGMPKVSKDGLVWTIKMKKGVKYSRNACFGLDDKGKPKTRTVTAGDFVLAFKRIADIHVRSDSAMAFVGDMIVGLKEYRKKSENYRQDDYSRFDKEKLSGVVALDDLTLQMTLKQNTPHFIHFLAIPQYAPYPREIIDHYFASPDNFAGTPRMAAITLRLFGEIRHSKAVVGTGPYVISKHIPRNIIVLSRNPDFRDQHYPSQGAPGDRAAGLLADAGKRLPFIDRIEFIWTPSRELSWKHFCNGIIDRNRIPWDSFLEIVGPDLKVAKEYADKGIRLAGSRFPSVFWLAINMKDPILGKSKSLRQALSLCIDRKDYIRTLFQRRGKPAINCLPSTLHGHSAAGPGPYARFDLAAARKKLIDARKELAAAGLLKSGQVPTLTLDIGTTDAVGKKMAKLFQKQFAAIGLEVDVKLNDWPTMLGKIHEGTNQMVSIGWVGDYPDPENFLQLFYSPNIGPTINTTRYSNRAYDDLYRKFTSLPYGPERDVRCKKLVNIISEDCPILLLYEPLSVFVHHKWLRNVKRHPVGYRTDRYLRIDTKARQATQIKRRRRTSR